LKNSAAARGSELIGSSSFSNVVSVAKNDELNNSVAVGRKVKGVYERIW
jgi:hypothetical protein